MTERINGQSRNTQLTGKAAEFGDRIEMPRGLRGEEILSIPGEIYDAAPERHTSLQQRIKVCPELVINKLIV